MRKLLLAATILAGSFTANGQGMAVNNTGTAADASSIMDLASTTKGLLAPRMDSAHRVAITSPATGLLVYQTDQTEGFWYKEAAGWKPLGMAGGSSSVSLSAGFSASLPSFSLSGTGATQFTGWSVSSPFYTGTGFNIVTGNYTVPATGKYTISAVVNYKTTAAVTISQSTSIDPSFVVRRTSPTTTDLTTGLMPILNVNIALVLSLRSVLGSAVVPLSTTVSLNAGDVIGLFYEADGLNLSLFASNVTWTIQPLF